jgi:hypothetical protein
MPAPGAHAQWVIQLTLHIADNLGEDPNRVGTVNNQDYVPYRSYIFYMSFRNSANCILAELFWN